MDEGKNRVEGSAPSEQLERRVAGIRNNLTRVVSELDHRRHEVFDWRLQARNHKGQLALLGTTLLAVTGAIVGLAIWRRRQRERPTEKVRRLRRALARMIDAPEAVARAETSIPRKAALAASAAAAGALAKALTQRSIAAARLKTR